jgi:hypothetical protein
MEFIGKDEISHHGAQRKYTIAASKLLTMGVYTPEVQRDIRKEHVEEIYTFQVAHYDRVGCYCFLGVLTFAVYDGKYFCLDGQHRYAAVRQLYTTFGRDFYLDIEELACATEAEMIEYFRVINLNSPVPDFLRDFKPQVGVVLRRHLKDTYGRYLSSAAAPHKPNIALDAFLSKMQVQHGGVLDTLGTADAIVGWFEATNAAHGDWLASMASDEPDIKKSLESVRKRVAEGAPALFLGCFWLEDLPRSFTKPKRKKVWETYAKTAPKDEDGCVACPCCESTLLSPFEFEVGHIRSHKNGGSNALDNLIPICSLCNKSMGAMNFHEYKACRS